MKPFKKLKQAGAERAGAGWHKHINKWEKRYANGFIRRFLRKEQHEYDD